MGKWYLKYWTMKLKMIFFSWGLLSESNWEKWWNIWPTSWWGMWIKTWIMLIYISETTISKMRISLFAYGWNSRCRLLYLIQERQPRECSCFFIFWCKISELSDKLSIFRPPISLEIKDLKMSLEFPPSITGEGMFVRVMYLIYDHLSDTSKGSLKPPKPEYYSYSELYEQ